MTCAIPYAFARRGPAWPVFSLPLPLAPTVGVQVLRKMLHAPFDALRSQYARSVRAGLAPRSMLASRDFDNGVDALEQLVLGPLARSV